MVWCWQVMWCFVVVCEDYCVELFVQFGGCYVFFVEVGDFVVFVLVVYQDVGVEGDVFGLYLFYVVVDV